MELGQMAAIVGGILGGVGGLVGGGVGTYFSIKNTVGPQERAFVIRCSCCCWAAVVGSLVLLFLLPMWGKWLVWIPFSILMPLVIPRWNKEQARLRSEEAARPQKERA